MDDPISSEPLRKHTPLQHQKRIAMIPGITDLLFDCGFIMNPSKVHDSRFTVHSGFQTANQRFAFIWPKCYDYIKVRHT